MQAGEQLASHVHWQEDWTEEGQHSRAHWQADVTEDGQHSQAHAHPRLAALEPHSVAATSVRSSWEQPTPAGYTGLLGRGSAGSDQPAESVGPFDRLAADLRRDATVSRGGSSLSASRHADGTGMLGAAHALLPPYRRNSTGSAGTPDNDDGRSARQHFRKLQARWRAAKAVAVLLEAGETRARHMSGGGPLLDPGTHARLSIPDGSAGAGGGPPTRIRGRRMSAPAVALARPFGALSRAGEYYSQQEQQEIQ